MQQRGLTGHHLETAEGKAHQDTERKWPQEGHSQGTSRDQGGRDLSRHGKKELTDRRRKEEGKEG